MRKRLVVPSVVGRSLFAFFILLHVDRIVSAADFVVTTRERVLELTSQIQATQFLTHATFGATAADVDTLALQMRTIGTVAAANAWIDNQITLPASLQNPLEDAFVETDKQYWSIYNRTGIAPNYVYTLDTTYSNTTLINSTMAMSRTAPRNRAWFHNAIAGTDQLRLKTAWALSQIFSVSNNANNFNEEEYESTININDGNSTLAMPRRSRFQGLTTYYDIFATNAFGNYRDILGKVTYHAIMGDWLSYRGNRRAQGGVFPDENYAREVMQLFTIGLYMLNDDGTQQIVGDIATPTYDADDIREYAEVFTGLGYGYGTYYPTNTTLNPYSPYSAGTSTDPNGSLKFQVPMRMAPSQHDRSNKVLLNGLVLTNPNGANVAFPTSLAGEAQANAEVDAALTGLFNHQSCPPFIVQRLIQRFVKSNPSKAYVSRIVAKFKNNGSGVRGDMLAVVRAILTDPEAWQPIRVQYQRAPINKFIVTTMGSEDSRLQEPVVNYTRFIRFFKHPTTPVEYQIANLGTNTFPGFTTIPALPANVLSHEYRLNSTDGTFDQSPYEAPSVFNFYLAEFRPTGEFQTVPVSSRMPLGVLVAPEFNIVTAVTSNNTNNFFRGLVVNQYRNEGIQTLGTISGSTVTGTSTTNTANVLTLATQSTRTKVNFSFLAEQNLVFGTAGSPTTADIDKLIERLDLYLCGGTLSQGYKTRLRTEIQAEVTRLVPPLSTAEASSIARGAVLSIVTAPSFLVTE